jgi:hypothetical protein
MGIFFHHIYKKKILGYMALEIKVLAWDMQENVQKQQGTWDMVFNATFNNISIISELLRTARFISVYK